MTGMNKKVNIANKIFRKGKEEGDRYGDRDTKREEIF